MKAVIFLYWLKQAIRLVSFLRIFFLIILWGWVCVQECRCPQRPKALNHLGLEVTRLWPPEVGAGNQIQVLCKRGLHT